MVSGLTAMWGGRSKDESGGMAVETAYRYRSSATWSNHRRGIVEAEGIPRTINFSAPPEFQGDPGLWTPEHLLTASVATCFLSTFRAIAEISKLEIIALEIKVEGLLEKVQGGFRFTQFTIYPKVTVPEDKDEERAFRLLEKAEHACLITRSLSARVVVEATVVAGVAPVGV